MSCNEPSATREKMRGGRSCEGYDRASIDARDRGAHPGKPNGRATRRDDGEEQMERSRVQLRMISRITAVLRRVMARAWPHSVQPAACTDCAELTHTTRDFTLMAPGARSFPRSDDAPHRALSRVLTRPKPHRRVEGVSTRRGFNTSDDAYRASN